MTTLTVGSLFSGYGGLDLAIHDVFPDARTVFVADVCKTDSNGAGHHEPCRAPCTILAHRFPTAANLGDVSKVDWSQVEPVDILAGGFPCQDVSAAGKRAGLRDGTRSGLWHQMARAIDAIRPRMVVIENVRGLLTARGAESDELDAADLEVARLTRVHHLIRSKQQRHRREGDTSHDHFYTRDAVRIMGSLKRAVVARRRAERRIVRAVGTVLGHLADLGYDARWYGLRAADVGAPHGRFRVFIVAFRADAAAVAADLGHQRGGTSRGRGPGPADRGVRADVALLGTPRASEWKGTGPVGSKSHKHRLDRDYLDAQVIQLAGSSPPLLPTPTSMDSHASGGGYNGQSNVTLTDATVRQTHGPEWGEYGPAIDRWVPVIGRPAPSPTTTSTKGNPQLAPRFVEWMMGLPAGWVTDVPGITRNEALKALGNGVVPQQGTAALLTMLAWEVAA